MWNIHQLVEKSRQRRIPLTFDMAVTCVSDDENPIKPVRTVLIYLISYTNTYIPFFLRNLIYRKKLL